MEEIWVTMQPKGNRTDELKVSNLGNVLRNGEPCHVVEDKDGYLRVYMHSKPCPVHRLVCRAFHGPRNGLQSRHKNGNKKDNRAENLTWGTQSDNARDSILHGTSRLLRQNGEANHAARMTAADVTGIRKLSRAGATVAFIASLFGERHQNISRIILRQRWAHVA